MSLTRVALINPAIPQGTLPYACRPDLDDLLLKCRRLRLKKMRKLSPERDFLRADKHTEDRKYFYSYGLLSIASVLQAEECEVQYFQEDFLQHRNCWRETLVQAATADVVGISSLSVNAEHARYIGKTIKKINPNVYLVFGGPDPTSQYPLYLEQGADRVVLGEGEVSMVEIIKNRRTNSNKYILGTVSCQDKRWIDDPRTQPVDLSKLPPPAFHLLDPEMKKRCGLYIVSSRGCSHRCTFCREYNFFNRKVRLRSPEALVHELDVLYNNFNVDETFLHFADSNFDCRPYEEFTKILEILNSRKGLLFNCNLRPDIMNKQKKELLRQKGLIGITIGIESASNRVLKKMGKKLTFAEILRFLESIEGAIPIVESHWMFGFPGETKDSAEESLVKLQFLLERGFITEAWPKIFVPYPGTDVYCFPNKYGIRLSVNLHYNRFAIPSYSLGSLAPMEIYEYWRRARCVVGDWAEAEIKRNQQ